MSETKYLIVLHGLVELIKSLYVFDFRNVCLVPELTFITSNKKSVILF